MNTSAISMITDQHWWLAVWHSNELANSADFAALPIVPNVPSQALPATLEDGQHTH